MPTTGQQDVQRGSRSDDGSQRARVDGPNRVVGAIGVTNFDDARPRSPLVSGTDLSNSHEKCNGQVMCWAEVARSHWNRLSCLATETVTTQHHIGAPITFVNNFAACALSVRRS